MVLAGVEGERGRDGDELGALDREDPIQLGEAQVVADAEPDTPALDLAGHGLVPGLLRLRLAVHVPAHLDVEQVDLAVDGGDLALGVEDDARVRELLAAVAPLGDRAAHERDPVRARPAAHRLDRLAAVERLGDLEEDLGRPDAVPLLGQEDDVGAGRGGAGHERLGSLDVVRLRARGVELDAGDAQRSAIAHRIALSGGPEPRRDPGGGAHDRARRRLAPPRAAQQLGDAATCSAPATGSSPSARWGPRRSSDSAGSARSPTSTSPSTSWTCSGAPSTAPRSRWRRSPSGAGALWLQLGIVSPEARRIAEAAGLDYVEDECTAIVHRSLAR